MSILDRRLYRRRWFALIGVAAISTAIGCQTPDCQRCRDFSAAAIPLPPGSYVCGWTGLQRDRADEVDFIIHQHEWYQDGDELGPRGREHLNVLARRLPHCSKIVVVEPHEVRIAQGEKISVAIERGRELDRVRREQIVLFFAEAGLADASERVMIDFPQDEGLMGAEAPRLYRQLLRSGSRGGGNSNLGGAGIGSGLSGGLGGSSAGGYF